MGVLIELNETNLLMKSEPTLLEKVVFWQKWSYEVKVPIKSINKIEVRRRYLVNTAYVSLLSDNGNNVVAFSLNRANSNELKVVHCLKVKSEILNYYNFKKFLTRKRKKSDQRLSVV